MATVRIVKTWAPRPHTRGVHSGRGDWFDWFKMRARASGPRQRAGRHSASGEEGEYNEENVMHSKLAMVDSVRPDTYIDNAFPK